MECDKWTTVLIEWINCLKLSPTVHNIAQLKDVAFLSSLLKLLYSAEPFTQQDTLTSLFKHLKLSYSKIIFDNVDEVHLSDLSESDLVTICSLLMHYTCTVDKRDTFIKPLCSTLSKQVQISIRMFLEKMNHNICNRNLHKIIKQCAANETDSESPRSTERYFMSGDSPLVSRSPLQDFLRVPITRKIPLQEREIRKLRSELDLERYEKADLQEELQAQQHRNKILSKQISDKNSEVSKIRNELASLECRSPPHQHVNMCGIEKTLRSEINNLELYISQLQTEQEQLQDDRDDLKEQLKKTERQCAVWQQEVEIAEQNYDTLQDKQEHQTAELENLRSQCKELGVLLEELRSSRVANDTFLESDNSQVDLCHKPFDSYASFEDLAHSVVDVQLRETQKDNEELKEVLKATKDSNAKLKYDLENLKCKISELTANYQTLYDENEQLIDKVSVLTETQNTLQKTQTQLFEAAEQVTQLSNTNFALNEKIVEITSELEQQKIVTRDFESLNSSLLNDLKDTKQDYVNLNLVLTEKNQRYATLEKHANKVEKQYDRLLEKYNRTSFDFDSITKNFAELNSSMEKSLQKLENFVIESGDSGLNYEDKNAVFMAIFEQLEEKWEQQIIERNTLSQKVVTLQELVDGLSNEVGVLNDRESISLQEKQALKMNLATAEEKLNTVQDTVDNYSQKIDFLNNTVTEMTQTIVDLEKLKDMINDRDSIISDLESACSSLEVELSLVNEEIVRHKGNEEKLQIVLDDLRAEKYAVEVKLSSTYDELMQHKESEKLLRKRMEELADDKSELESKLKNAILHHQEKTEELSRVIVELETTKDNYEKQVEDQHANLLLLQQNEQKLQDIVADVEAQKCSLESQLDKAHKDIVKCNEIQDALQNDIFEKKKLSLETKCALNLQIEEQRAKLRILETDLENSRIECLSLKKQLNETSEVKAKIEAELEDCKITLNNRIVILEKTVEKLQHDLHAVTQERDAVKESFTQKNTEYASLHQEKIEQIDRHKMLLHQFNEISDKLKKKEEECLDRDDLLSKSNNELLLFKLEAEEKHAEIKSMEGQIVKLYTKKKEMKSAIAALENENENLNSKVRELGNEIRVIENLKHNLEQKVSTIEEHKQKILAELADKNEELVRIVSDHGIYRHESEQEISKLRKLLKESIAKVEALTDERNSNISNYKHEINSLVYQIGELTSGTEKLREKELSYVKELRTVKDELVEATTSYTQALQEQQELKVETEQEINNLTENLHSVVAKFNKLDGENKEIERELTITKEKLFSLENNKLELEVELSQQKLMFEEEYEKCKQKLNLELDVSRKKQEHLEKQVATLLKQEEKSCKVNGNKLAKLRKKFNDAKENETLLLQRLTCVTQQYEEAEENYKSIKILHEDYVRQQKEEFENLQADLLQKLDTLSFEKELLEKAVVQLSGKVEALEERSNDITKFYKEKYAQKVRLVECLQSEIESCKARRKKIMCDQEEHMKRMSMEKKKVERLTGESHLHQAKMKESEARIMSLKCANEVLETGKINLELEISMMAEKVQKLEALKLSDEIKLIEELKTKDHEIAHMNKENELMQTKISENDTEIETLTTTFESTKHSLQILKNQDEKLNKIMVEEKQASLEKLNETKHSAEEKLNELKTQINNTRKKYANVCEEITVLKQENVDVQEKLSALTTEKESVNKEAEEKGNLVMNLSKTIEDQSNLIETKEREISELNTKVQNYLSAFGELENEKVSFKIQIDALSQELNKLKKDRDNIVEAQDQNQQNTEQNVLGAHSRAMEFKNELLERLSLKEIQIENERRLKNDLELLLDGEKKSKKILEITILDLTNEKSKYQQLLSTFKDCILKLASLVKEKPLENLLDYCVELDINTPEGLTTIINLVEKDILNIISKKNHYNDKIKKLEHENEEIQDNIERLSHEKESLMKEKNNLIDDYNLLCTEKLERDSKIELHEVTVKEYEALKDKYADVQEEITKNQGAKSKNFELEERMIELKTKNAKMCECVEAFTQYYKDVRTKIDCLVTERNGLDAVFNNMKQTIDTILYKTSHVTENYEPKILYEKKQSLEIIYDDIQKQFSRLSKNIQEVIFNFIPASAKIVNSLLPDDPTSYTTHFEALNIAEALDNILDFKERITNALEQAKLFDNAVESKDNNKIHKEKILRATNKTNIQNFDGKIKEEEWKKKNLALRQRLTLSENSKMNLEKKVKQLRDEKNALMEKNNDNQEDAHYKILLQQYIHTKEDHERVLKQCNEQYENLVKEYEEYKTNTRYVPKMLNHDGATKLEKDIKLEKELQKLREAYANMMSDSSKLQLENATMRKLLDDRTSQLSELDLIKETYEKLLEDKNKLMIELDTIKYKRNRDREEYIRLLKKEKDEANNKEMKKIQDIKYEYEIKLEKMKEKMIRLYKEEVDKELQKLASDKNDNRYLLQTIDQLKRELKATKSHLQEAFIDRSKAMDQLGRSKIYGECDRVETAISNRQIKQEQIEYINADESRTSIKSENVFLRNREDSDDSVRSVANKRRGSEDKKYATVSKSSGMDVIKEVGIRRHASVNTLTSAISQNLEMEDEGDLFNNKYLTDLKEGRCVLPSGRESNAYRISELQWRNSLCPPHLKSSYAAETQFNGLERFREEDIKVGVAEFDDSMSTRLIPGEKPRKKDFGTTSYKKPGPPTPSKNGGRVSLQGNEPHPRDVLREQNEVKTPKKTTPSRLKMLFTGRNNSTRDNSEVGKCQRTLWTCSTIGCNACPCFCHMRKQNIIKFGNLCVKCNEMHAKKNYMLKKSSDWYLKLSSWGGKNYLAYSIMLLMLICTLFLECPFIYNQ